MGIDCKCSLPPWRLVRVYQTASSRSPSFLEGLPAPIHQPAARGMVGVVISPRFFFSFFLMTGLYSKNQPSFLFFFFTFFLSFFQLTLHKLKNWKILKIWKWSANFFLIFSFFTGYIFPEKPYTSLFIFLSFLFFYLFYVFMFYIVN